MTDDDARHMSRALNLAAHGLGRVEPNPMVGAVVTDQTGRVVGEGWHRDYGGPHAEVHALEAAGEAARGGTLYVTLEPCCHFGKTPPCSRAVIAAGVSRVVVAMSDPAPHVAGGGIAELRAAGIQVDIGTREADARVLVAPFVKLQTRGLPWVHAKWAMSLDGKIATRIGHSQWISNEASRAVVQELRGRMDAIVVGIGTALADDPRLTARPAGPRTAIRVVIDSRLQLPLDSRLATTARDTPVLIFARDDASSERRAALESLGVEVVTLPVGNSGRLAPISWLNILGQRGLTNVLVEGGGKLLGSLRDDRQIDEFHVFVAPKVIGGATAPSPMGGIGVEVVSEIALEAPVTQVLDGDVYIRTRLRSAL